MSLQPSVRKKLERVLSTVEDHGSLGPRLMGDALRLWDRLRKFASMNLVGPGIDTDALELACYALQLPSRQTRGISPTKPGRTNLRDRCEQAAELLVSLIGAEIEESLLDRTTRILHEVPHRSPVIDDARLMADALNLDDFGLTGLIAQAIQIGMQGEGVGDLVTAMDKRDQYGYWDVRLKDGFHFEPVRAIARRRLETARQVAKMLRDELREDQP